MATGSHLKIMSMGDNVMGVELLGDPKRPEPIHFRVMFPGGDIDIVRTTDNEYWAHIRVNRKADGWDPDRQMGRLVDARLDSLSKHASEMNPGDFADPDLYHLAVRIQPISE